MARRGFSFWIPRGCPQSHHGSPNPKSYPHKCPLTILCAWFWIPMWNCQNSQYVLFLCCLDFERDFSSINIPSIQFSSLVNIPSIRGVQWVPRLLFHPSSPLTLMGKISKDCHHLLTAKALGILLTSGVFNLVSSRSKSWFNWPRKSIATYFSKPLVF